MTSVVAYIKNILGWTNLATKRNRLEDDNDDGVPPFKIFRRPDSCNSFINMSAEEERISSPSRVRYVPIVVEGKQASTSTPQASRRVMDLADDQEDPPIQSPKTRKDLNTSVGKRGEDSDFTKNPNYFIDLDDDEDDDNDENNSEDDDEDVIFVERKEYHPVRASHFFQSYSPKSPRLNNGSPNYSLFNQSLRNRATGTATSNKINSRFKPSGVSKIRKKEATPVPKWMQTIQTRSRNQKINFLNNNNSGPVLQDIYNYKAKLMYQNLIKEAISGKRYSQDSFVNRNNSSLLNKNKNQSTNRLSTSKIYISSDSEVEEVKSEPTPKVDPVNTLKDSFKKIAIANEDWLKELKAKESEKKAELDEKFMLVEKESGIMDKLRLENTSARLERELKSLFELPACLVEESKAEPDFPVLTQEQEMLVDKAFAGGRPDDLFIEKFNLRIHRRDLHTLKGLSWLNDEVINFYMNLLMQRSQDNPKLPKVYATNTFFFPKLLQGGQPGLRRWTRKVDIFSHDLMVIPVHLGVHWCVALVRFGLRRVEYLDSMGANNPQALAALIQYLRDEHRDKRSAPLADGWTTACLSAEIPQQMNGSDCGMFCCTFAEFASRGATFTFTQAHMPYLRRKVACEIIQGKLLN